MRSSIFFLKLLHSHRARLSRSRLSHHSHFFSFSLTRIFTHSFQLFLLYLSLSLSLSPFSLFRFNYIPVLFLSIFVSFYFSYITSSATFLSIAFKTLCTIWQNQLSPFVFSPFVHLFSSLSHFLSASTNNFLSPVSSVPRAIRVSLFPLICFFLFQSIVLPLQVYLYSFSLIFVHFYSLSSAPFFLSLLSISVNRISSVSFSLLILSFSILLLHICPFLFLSLSFTFLLFY